MRRFLALAKTACVDLFASFVNSRLLAEMPGADELIQVRRDHPGEDPRRSDGLPVVGVL